MKSHMSKADEKRDLKIVLSVGIALVSAMSLAAALLDSPALSHAATAVGVAVNIRWVWA